MICLHQNTADQFCSDALGRAPMEHWFALKRTMTSVKNSPPWSHGAGPCLVLYAINTVAQLS